MLMTPWRARGFPGTLPVPAQLHRDEIDYLYWLAASARGRVVELGCFLGGSTYALVRGMDDAGAEHRLTTYDSFVMPRPSPDFTTPYREGENFRPLFESYLRDYLHRIDIREGWLPPDARGDDARRIYQEQEPIEVLFIDCAKQWPVHCTILHAFAPCLIPHVSVVVQQDFKAGLHWLPLHMYQLRECFHPVHDVTGGTLSFRYAGNVEKHLASLWEPRDIPAREVPDLWLRVIDHFSGVSPAVRLGVVLSAARHLFATGHLQRCDETLTQWRQEFELAENEPWKHSTLALWTAAIAPMHRCRAAEHDDSFAHELGAHAAWGRAALEQISPQRGGMVDAARWDRAVAALASEGIREIALYGAGHHTRDLLASGWPNGRVRISTIVDDHMYGSEIQGVAVVKPAELPATVSAVLISSRHHEGALAKAAARSLKHALYLFTMKRRMPRELSPTAQFPEACG